MIDPRRELQLTIKAAEELLPLQAARGRADLDRDVAAQPMVSREQDQALCSLTNLAEHLKTLTVAAAQSPARLIEALTSSVCSAHPDSPSPAPNPTRLPPRQTRLDLGNLLWRSLADLGSAVSRGAAPPAVLSRAHLLPIQCTSSDSGDAGWPPALYLSNIRNRSKASRRSSGTTGRCCPASSIRASTERSCCPIAIIDDESERSTATRSARRRSA